MGNSSLKAIQQSIYNLLTSSTPLMAIISGVFDDVPTGTLFPYISTGDVVENNFNTFDRTGRDVAYTMHIWSQHDGFAECYDILNLVNPILDYKEISVNGFSLVYCRYDNSQSLRDPDGETFHLIVQYRIITQE